MYSSVHTVQFQRTLLKTTTRSRVLTEILHFHTHSLFPNCITVPVTEALALAAIPLGGR